MSFAQFSATQGLGEMQSRYAVKVAVLAAYRFILLGFVVLNGDTPLPFAFAGLLCV